MAERKNVVFLVTSGEKKTFYCFRQKAKKEEKNRIERKEKICLLSFEFMICLVCSNFGSKLSSIAIFVSLKT
jgi:hypothetical protein